MKDVQDKQDQPVLGSVMKSFHGTEYKVFFVLPKDTDAKSAMAATPDQAAKPLTVHKVEFVNNPHATELSKTCPTYTVMVREFCKEHEEVPIKVKGKKSPKTVPLQEQVQAQA